MMKTEKEMPNGERQDWIDVAYAHAEVLTSIAAQLQGLSRAFALTGNGVMANVLADTSGALRDEVDVARKLVSDRLTADLAEAQRSNGVMMTAMLAGINVKTSLTNTNPPSIIPAHD
jgi:hypothetical protein